MVGNPLVNSGALDLFGALAAAARGRSALVAMRGGERSRALKVMAKALRAAQNEILEANTLDLEASREKANSGLPSLWIKFTPDRLQQVADMLDRLADLPDPTRQAIRATHQTQYLQSYCQLMPLGTIALVHEGLPELGAIAAGMGIKTGNSMILYGSSDTKHTNAAIAAALTDGLTAGELPPECVTAIPPDRDISMRDLLAQERYLNLIVAYGRPKLVQQASQFATVPILGAAIGNCYLYWALSGELDVVRWAISDSHQGDPEAVNAIEKVLVHERHNRSMLGVLFGSLQTDGFEVRVDAHLQQDFPDLPLAADDEWNRPYLTKIVAFRTVASVEEAIAVIHTQSSGHADCIATESYREAHQFASRLDSASTYINASPRFQRNPRGSASVFLGMSNQKGYRRGAIGLDMLTTIKQIVQGDG